MRIVYVELSQDSPELARWEAISAAESLGGRSAAAGSEFPGLTAVEIPPGRDVTELADRLALARRCLVRLGGSGGTGLLLAREGGRGETAAVRRLGRPTGPSDAAILQAGEHFVRGGGRIDLDHPARRFWAAHDAAGQDELFEELGRVDRGALAERRMPRLPFQRPVSLPPRLARAAANLARAGPGCRILDPFLGTGALLAEAGLLGAQIFGIDRSSTMVRGALRNLEFLGVDPESVLVGDAGEVDFPEPVAPFDAILTDPPYGRASTTGGEAADRLLGRVMPRWAGRLVPGGRIVLIVPRGTSDPVGMGPPLTAIPVRVHRSLTREFRVYGPAGAWPEP